MNHDKTPTGHLAAFITILIWGTTFISTKVLLETFSPVEILFIRFVMGYLALWLVCPRTLKLDSRRQEPLFMAAGLCGITMYYLLENIALTFTLASNVGVIISIAPFFTAILSCLFLGGTRPGRQFFIGFLLAMAGIFLLSFGSSSLSINPMGDILAVAAAIIWAVYSTLTKKISALGYGTIQTTRRTFFYGLIFMIPALALMDFNVSLSQVTSPLMIRPYRHTPSARPTKINDLPRMELSSLIAPRAALAAADTAMPPPRQESPVERAAERYPMPAAEDPAAWAPASAAWALPENMTTAAKTMVPKNRNILAASAVL